MKILGKYLVIGLIVLFIGASIVPIIESKTYNKNNSQIIPLDWPCECDIIVPDDYPTIQEAINHASPGYCICVRNGTYNENIRIEIEDLTLCGEDKTNTIIYGEDGTELVMVIRADGVTIRGFTIRSSIMQNRYIYVNANSTNIIDNIINVIRAIILGYSSNNVISNTFLSETWGIALVESAYSHTIRDNTFESGGILISEYIAPGSYLTSHTIVNNTLNGRPIYYYKNQNNIVVPGNCAQLIMAKCDNFTVENLEISHTSAGISIYDSDDNEIINNNITDGIGGILLMSSDNNIVQNNNIQDISRGIVGFSLKFNEIKQNIIINNDEFSDLSINGIYLIESSYNNISFNTISKNGLGIVLDSGELNVVFSNTVFQSKTENDEGAGIYLYAESRSDVMENNVYDCDIAITFHISQSCGIGWNTIFNNIIGLGIYDRSAIGICSDTGVWKNEIFDNNYGIDIYGVQHLFIQYNNIIDNYLPIKITGSKGRCKISDNNIESAAAILIQIQQLSFIDARGNWWGSTSWPRLKIQPFIAPILLFPWKIKPVEIT